MSALIITKSDLLGVKGTATTSNNTAEVERVLGIEAARWVFEKLKTLAVPMSNTTAKWDSG